MPAITQEGAQAERIARLPAWARQHIAALHGQINELADALAAANDGTGDGSVTIRRGDHGTPDVVVDDRYGIRWSMPPTDGAPPNDRFWIDVKRSSPHSGYRNGPHMLQVMGSGPLVVVPEVSNVLQIMLRADR